MQKTTLIILGVVAAVGFIVVAPVFLMAGLCYYFGLLRLVLSQP